MSLPNETQGSGFLERLREYRNTAFVTSYWYGVRHRDGLLGKLSVGQIEAGWKSKEGGTSHLTDHGLHYGSKCLTSHFPTRLRISEHVPEKPELAERTNKLSLKVITFYMNLDDTGSIEIYHNIFTSNLLSGSIGVQLGKRQDWVYGLQEPSEYETELLLDEMQRGASGSYKVPSYDFDDF